MMSYQHYFGLRITALQKSSAHFSEPKKLSVKPFIFTVLIAFCASLASAQKPRTKIQAGIPSPDFSMNVQLQGKGTPVKKTLADYRGRWLLLEFWSKTCATCIEGFPKLQEMQDSLSDQMDFILVGKNDKRYNEGIASMYARIAKEENLKLNVAFDTLSFSSFGVWATPNAVVISPEGIIKSISAGAEITLNSLRKLISGHQTDITQFVDGKIVSVDKNLNKRIILDTTGAFAHRSELSNWIFSEGSFGARSITSGLRKGSFYTSMSTLGEMYMLAYFGNSMWTGRDSIYGKLWPRPLLKLRDSSLFASNFSKQKNLFTYRIDMDNKTATVSDVQSAFQQDLINWFGNKVSIHTREMPIWRLVVLDQNRAAQLKTTSSMTEIIGDHSGIIMKKVLPQNIVYLINSYYNKHITIDATAIEGEVDITIEANLSNLSSLKKALALSGLGIIQSTKQMQVLVISDKNP